MLKLLTVGIFGVVLLPILSLTGSEAADVAARGGGGGRAGGVGRPGVGGVGVGRPGVGWVESIERLP